MLRREFIIALSATAAAWPLAVRAQEPKHRIYHAPANLFAEQYTDYNFGPIRIAMGQLIDRYGIRNKRVLALGAGSCFEEQYFVELGNNQLTVVDIDENKSAEYALKLADPGPMGYIIGDALDFDPDEYNVFCRGSGGSNGTRFTRRSCGTPTSSARAGCSLCSRSPTASMRWRTNNIFRPVTGNLRRAAFECLNCGASRHRPA